MNKLVFLSLTAIPIIMMLNVTGSGGSGIGVNGTLTVQDVFGGGPRFDYDEKYPEYADCWTDGWDDGQDHPFDQDRNDECKGEDKGNQYYRAFIFGCKDAGNSEETCERFTD